MSTADDAHRAWDANAAFWDARMGDGNDFFEMLLWPPIMDRLVQRAAAGARGHRGER